MLRKMFLMGALCMGLANVGAIGAWAAPSDPKLVAMLSAMPSNEGCPPTNAVSDETTDFQPPDRKPVGPVLPPLTPCQRATKALADIDKDIEDLTTRKQEALDQMAIDRERLRVEEDAIERFKLKEIVDLAQNLYDGLTGDLSDANNRRPQVLRLKELECNPVVKEDLGPAPRPAPDPVVAEEGTFFLVEGVEGGS